MWLRSGIAVAPIQPLSWEPLYALGAAHQPEKKKQKTKKKKQREDTEKRVHLHLMSFRKGPNNGSFNLPLVRQKGSLEQHLHGPCTPNSWVPT